MDPQLKRISVLIREDQSQKLSKSGLNVSGLIRDLIDDHFSAHQINLAVSEETRRLYQQVISNTGSTDEDLEKYLRTALGSLLQDKITAMQALKKTAFGDA
jgi:hypothetical protein